MSPDYDAVMETLHSSGSTWSKANENILLEPYTYITSTPGKSIRTQLTTAFNLWLNVPEEKLAIINNVVSMLHSSSLLVDDIEDDAQLRRGAPVAHKIYGIPQTINSANYVYFLAYNELFLLKPEKHSAETELHRIITNELLSLHRGQGIEIFWRDSLQCPTEEEYISMVNDKTGGLFRIGMRLMMACSTTNFEVDYVPLTNLLGVYFQIRDDYMNLQSTQYSNNKGFAEDLTEGKFSFPIVHSVRSDASNRQLLNVLQKRPTTPTLKNYAINYLQKQTNSFDYTLKVMEIFQDKISKEIERLGGNPKLEAFVQALSSSVPPIVEG